MARVAGVKKDILRVLEQRGTVSSPHNSIRAALKLTKCNYRELIAALDMLVEEGKVQVNKTATHITLSLRD